MFDKMSIVILIVQNRHSVSNSQYVHIDWDVILKTFIVINETKNKVIGRSDAVLRNGIGKCAVVFKIPNGIAFNFLTK